MQPFEWSEDFSVDIPQIDAQHRQIIELLGELGRCTRRGESDNLVASALERLDQYAESHLRREELVLAARGYPGYAEHKAEHDPYQEKLAFLRAHSDRRDLGIRIVNFLSKWWRNHILNSDQQYARFFRRGRPASRAG